MGKLKVNSKADALSGLTNLNRKPMVGIFFMVDGELIMDAVSVDKGEPFGDISIEHGSHYDYWGLLNPKTLEERRFKARAYDAYPRGRVVYFHNKKIFRIYHDTCIDEVRLKEIVKKFALSGAAVEFARDEHYKCADCNTFYVD